MVLLGLLRSDSCAALRGTCCRWPCGQPSAPLGTAGTAATMEGPRGGRGHGSANNRPLDAQRVQRAQRTARTSPSPPSSSSSDSASPTVTSGCSRALCSSGGITTCVYKQGGGGRVGGRAGLI